jgi:chromosome segregation ATPase
MVEPLLYAALGFLTASLVALFMGRALWNRAVRLTTHRIMRRLPLSRDEIVASRDLLRAEVAIEHRKLERQTNIMREKMTQSMADVGRRDAANVALRTAVSEANAKIAALEAREKTGLGTTGRLKDEIESFKSKLEEMKTGLAEEQRKVRQREKERTELEHIAHTRQTEITAITNELKQMKLTADTLQNQYDTARKELEETKARLEKANETARDAALRAPERTDIVQQRIFSATHRADVGAEDITKLRQQIEWLALDLARVSATGNGGRQPDSPPPAANAPQTAAAVEPHTSVEADIFGS